MTRKVVSPIALDRSINTTEQTPRNIADVLAQQLEGIKNAIETGNGNLEAAFVCYYGITTATQIKDAIDDGKVPYFYYNGVVAQLWKVETDKYTFRTTNTRSVEGQTILDVVDYVVNGSVWSTITREVSGGSSSGQSYLASVKSLADFDTTGKSGMQDLISVVNVPADGVYQVSVMLAITPKAATATKSDLVFQFTGGDDTGWPNHTFHAVVDDSQTFAQQLSFSTSISLNAGTNTLKMACGGLNTEYLVFVDELTIAQLVNGVYHNGDDFADVHTLAEAADFNNDDGVLVDGATGGPRFMLWQTLANKVLGFIKSLATTISSFRTGDVIPVDGPLGTAKMSKDDLLEVTAQNALAGNVALAFDATKDYATDEIVSHNGGTYKFVADHSAGAWNASHVESYIVSDNVKNLSDAVELQVVTNDVSLGESNASFTIDPSTNTITHINGQTGKIKIAECIVGHKYVVLTSSNSGYDGNTYIQFCSGADGIGYTGSRFNIPGSKLYVTATSDYKYMFFNSIMTSAYSQVIGVIDVTGDAELEERVKTERYDVLGASSKEIERIRARMIVAESDISSMQDDIDELEHFDSLVGEEIKDIKSISTPNANVTINADDSVSFNGSSGRVCVAEGVANKRLLIFVDKDFPATGNLYFRSNSTKNETGYVGARNNIPAHAEYIVVVTEHTYLLMYSDWTTAFDLNIKIFDVTGNPKLESLLKNFNYLVRFNGVGGIYNGYVSDNVNKSIKSFVVDCWGDSLTQSWDENSVVSCLEKAINEKLGVRVNNYGNGGEKVLDIAGRQGGIPFKLASDVSIPATTDPVTLSLVSTWDGITAPSSNFIVQGQNGINKSSIAGIEGTISLSGGNIVFTRSASGDATTAKTGTLVYTNVDKIIGCNIQCIWAGQNDTISDVDEFVEKLINMCRRYEGERYVVLAPIYRSVVSDVVALESALQNEFGVKAITPRHYLNAYGIDVAISLGFIESATAQDITDIAAGLVPTSLRKDTVHLNSIGYKVLGYEIARILKLLYW